MSSMDSPSAMRRKAGAGRPPPEIGRMSPGRALRMAFALSAEKTLGLQAIAAEVGEERATVEAIAGDLPEHGLVFLLDAGDGSQGLCVLDPQVMGALIEVQTTGRVVPHEAMPRPPTRTDAVMCEEWVNALLSRFEAVMVEADLPEAALVGGFRASVTLADARAVSFALDEVPYRRFRLAGDLGNGAKSGALHLVFPAARASAEASGGAEGWHAALEAAVSDASCALGAELFRTGMTVAEIAALAPGDLVTIPRRAVTGVRLLDIEGRPVAVARLGQINGHRAVRLALEPSADETEMPAELSLNPARGAPAPLGDLPAPGGIGDIGDLGGIAEPGALPDLPDLPDLPAMSDLPDLPGLPGAGADELPELPDLPDLPGQPMADLPEITD